MRNFIRETQISGASELKFVSRTIPTKSEGIIGFAELRYAPVPHSPACPSGRSATEYVYKAQFGVSYLLIALILLSMYASIPGALAQEQTPVSSELKEIRSHSENLDHRLDRLEKMVDDLLWYQKLGDVAIIDKLYMYGPAHWNDKNTTAMGYGNPIKFWSYTFFPKNLDASKKYPLIVLPHGGVHADFTTYYTHIVRELVTQGYVVVAAEYRGSTGYGKGHYKNIDYGGLEVEDVFASRNYMLENYPFIDESSLKRLSAKIRI